MKQPIYLPSVYMYPETDSMLRKPGSSSIRLYALILCIFLLGACAKKPSLPDRPVTPEQEIADLVEFPQNLEIYAKEYGPNKRLLPESQQLNLNSSFDNIWFGPWQMNRTSISRRAVAGAFGRPRGYKNGVNPWTQAEWDAIKANANTAAFPSRCSKGIILRGTDLREVPTHEGRYEKPTPDPKKDPFDYFQYSYLPLGLPVLVAHTSLDRRWHYIECPIAGGWVDAQDVGIITDEFASTWRTGRYAALIKEKVVLPGTGINKTDSKGGIGCILPVVSMSATAFNVLVPVTEGLGTGTAEIPLSADSAAIKPMPLTAGNVAQVGNQMMGQPYGWGGMLELRDCSAMIRDLFAPFGIWLPRNSLGQSRRGKVIRLDNMTVAEKSSVILRDGVPFLSLVGLPGHITLYVGRWHNKPAIFHNAWGVRIIKDGNDDERHVIGKAVVTSIMPGMELPNLYRPKTFVDRIRSLNTPGQ